MGQKKKTATVPRSGRLRRPSPPSRPAQKGESRLDSFARAEGFIPGSRRDGQTITPDWTRSCDSIDGVKIREVKNVPKGRGFLTEVFRRDWRLDDGPVDQVFQVWIAPGEVSAWHVHRRTRDRLFVIHGMVKIVLYDARTGSPTLGRVNELRIGTARPALVTIPPGVWHGVQNLSSEPGGLLNLVDRAYEYEDPDHWRLPPRTAKIPYRFDHDPRWR